MKIKWILKSSTLKVSTSCSALIQCQLCRDVSLSEKDSEFDELYITIQFKSLEK